MRLKIYTDISCIPKSGTPVILLQPFLPEISPKYDPDNLGQKTYYEHASTYFVLTELERCDYGIFPVYWDAKYYELGEMLCDKARQKGKKVLFFSMSDWYDEVPFSNAIVFRNHIFRSQRKPNEFAANAGWLEDLLATHNNSQLNLIQWTPKPIIGFCGNGQPAPWSKKPITWIRYYKYIWFSGDTDKLLKNIRYLVLSLLEQKKRIDCCFDIYNTFFNGYSTIQHLDAETLNRHKEESRIPYIRNLLTTQYTVCIRGAGNFSHRFYEILSCGRIPLFIDTDCLLPFDFMIDWKKHFPWVALEHIDKIEDILLVYHQQFTPESFIEKQKELRQLWEEYLSYDGFFKNFHLHFQDFQ